MWKYTRNERGGALETSVENVRLHSKRVEKLWNYTRNEYSRYKNTLETSGKDSDYTRFQVTNPALTVPEALNYWYFYTLRPDSIGKNTLETSGEDSKTTLETSGEDSKTTPETSREDAKIHSKRVGKTRRGRGSIQWFWALSKWIWNVLTYSR